MPWEAAIAERLHGGWDLPSTSSTSGLAALGLGAGDLGIADDYGSYWSWFFSA